MKKIRTIWIMVIIAISLLLCTVVTIKWSELGCDIGSLIAGCAYYTSATCVLGAMIKTLRIMKPDGTHTTDEILEIIQNELQSWERDEICTALLDKCSDNQLSDYFSKYTPEYISTLTGYYVYESEREDIEDMCLSEIINGSSYSLFVFFNYIVKEVSSERLSDWIAESKLDKTILLNKLDRDFITEYFATHFEVNTETRIKLIKED